MSSYHRDRPDRKASSVGCRGLCRVCSLLHQCERVLPGCSGASRRCCSRKPRKVAEPGKSWGRSGTEVRGSLTWSPCSRGCFCGRPVSRGKEQKINTCPSGMYYEYILFYEYMGSTHSLWRLISKFHSLCCTNQILEVVTQPRNNLLSIPRRWTELGGGLRRRVVWHASKPIFAKHSMLVDAKWGCSRRVKKRCPGDVSSQLVSLFFTASQLCPGPASPPPQSKAQEGTGHHPPQNRLGDHLGASHRSPLEMRFKCKVLIWEMIQEPRRVLGSELRKKRKLI